MTRIPIRVLLVEDHAIVRDGIAALLSGEASLELVLSASSATEALARLPEFSPHVAIVDLNLPGMSGAEFVRTVRSLYAHVHCIALSSYADTFSIRDAIDSGARAFLSKSVTKAALVSAIHDTVAGRPVASMLGATAARATGDQLTIAELRVLRSLASGCSNDQIAALSGVSVNTVKTQVSRILKKLDVENRTSAIRIGRDLGLIT